MGGVAYMVKFAYVYRVAVFSGHANMRRDDTYGIFSYKTSTIDNCGPFPGLATPEWFVQATHRHQRDITRTTY